MFDTGAGVPGRDTAPLVARGPASALLHCGDLGRVVSLGEMSESANTGHRCCCLLAWHKLSLDNPGHSRSCEE